MAVLKCLALIAGLEMSLGGVFVATVKPEPPPLTREQQVEDLEFLRTHYLPKDGALDAAKRARASRIIDRFEDQRRSLSPGELFLAAFEVSAVSDNGHSHAGF